MLFYLVGILGSGMSALANILSDLGNEVYGADYDESFFTRKGLRRSIKVESFSSMQYDSKYFYIIGNAYKGSTIADNITFLKYRNMLYPEFIESYFDMPKIGISGSHGKTTATCFLSSMINNANVLIGDGEGIGVSNAEYFLFEACEYQNNFLKYSYEYLAILNIDYDHPDYFKSRDEYYRAFLNVSKNTRCLIVNNDDERCRLIKHPNRITFGFSRDSDVVIKSIGDGKIDLFYRGNSYSYTIDFVGISFVYDFVAAFTVSMLINGDCKANHIHLPRRRLNEYSINNKNIVIDDYAHHPTQITSSISYSRLRYPDKLLVAIFQPHTYSRTLAFLDEFRNALNSADVVYVLPVFSSVRENDENKDKLLLLRDTNFREYNLEEIKKYKNSVLLFMGAGDIDIEMKKLL